MNSPLDLIRDQLLPYQAEWIGSDHRYRAGSLPPRLRNAPLARSHHRQERAKILQPRRSTNHRQVTSHSYICQ